MFVRRTRPFSLYLRDERGVGGGEEERTLGGEWIRRVIGPPRVGTDVFDLS